MSDKDNNDGILLEPGPRVTSSEEILRIEREIGRENIDNPAIPASLVDGRDTVQEWRELIEEETQRDNPRTEVIAYSNGRIARLSE